MRTEHLKKSLQDIIISSMVKNNKNFKDLGAKDIEVSVLDEIFSKRIKYWNDVIQARYDKRIVERDGMFPLWKDMSKRLVEHHIKRLKGYKRNKLREVDYIKIAFRCRPDLLDTYIHFT